MVMQNNEIPIAVDQWHLVDPGLQNERLATLIKPILPADVALKPVGLLETKSEVLLTHVVPAGAYAEATVFTDKEQAVLRRMFPIVTGMLDIMDHEDNPALSDETVKIDLELMRLNAKAAQDRAAMVEALRQYHDLAPDDPRFDEKAVQLRRVFELSQDAIYPRIDEALARETLDRLLGLETDRQPILSAETRAAWHEYLHDEYDPVFEAVYDNFTSEEMINGEHLKDMTVAFMRESGLPMTDDMNDTSKWKARYDPSVSTFTVVPNKKEIIVGKRDKPLTRLQFEKLMMHEVVIHAWRQENGSESGFPAMQTGLPGYLETEEGIGLLVESLWSGEDPDSVGRDHYRYAAVAFADGAYDGIKHTEQETFDMIFALMDANGIQDDTNELHNHVMRVYRGMPPEWRMHSNLSYLSGKIKAMELFEQQFAAGISISDQFKKLCAGKYNPCDPAQVDVVDRIGRLSA